MRKLGIPVILDRIVGQSMHCVLEELFDPGFTDSNYGFHVVGGANIRPSVIYGSGCWRERSGPLSVDLKAFFDEIPHGLILQLDSPQSGG